MRKSLPLLLLLVLPLLAFAQSVTVPRNVYFADIHLTITDRGQQEIQKKVDALHRNPTYFHMKVDLANAYFPLIERTFKEEGVPDDFKYLALQESGLRGDAVSTSNAVGYWQFKKEAASDFNLRMDNVIDERRHIVEASRGAAKYFKRSNNYYDNWLITLLSYLEGYTGAKAYAKPSDKGAKRMEITDRTHPYVLTFLAHKVAYENFVGKTATPALSLREMRATPGQSLADIALATQTDPAELERYNKWLLGGSIPSDKDYFVMVPVRNGNDLGLLASTETAAPAVAQPAAKAAAAASVVKRNGLNALVARKGDTKDKLALQAGITTRQFLKYNDLRSFDKLEEGKAYYTQPKRSTADAEYHVVQAGETMQQISQNYGIKLQYLLFRNRMARNEVPVAGRVLWLQKRRPGTTPVEVRDQKQAQPSTASRQTSTAKTAPNTPKKATSAEQSPVERVKSFFAKLKKDLNLEKPQPAPQPEEETPATEPVLTSPETRPAQPAVSNKPEPAVVTEQKQAEKVEEVELVLPDTAATTQDTSGLPNKKSKEQPFPVKATDSTIVFQEEVKAPANPEKATEEQTAYPSKFPTKGQVEESEEFLGYENEPAVVEEKAPAKPIKPAAAPATKPVPAAAKPAPALQDQPAVKPARHTVKQGETLYSISRVYAVSVHDISKWNDLGDTPLKIGQELLIAEPQTIPEVTPEEEETPAAASSGYHTVVAGETLFQISKKYGLSVDEIRTWNGLTGNALSLGQQLRIVAPAAAPSKANEAPVKSEGKASGAGSSQAYHTVAQGESMYQISRKYGVTIKDIMEWNSKSDFSVKPGEKLLIKRR
ncbi:LysM peptidoglycan-binding domain-containing protein [Pontibacter ruber]|uniref:LysM peptidoglycan-binding domain-containing protein n=1 Tax=Pontibacter ruber TaxID=1343895 RepID=A0ABW5CXG9_9BACT|nr:LysM peptidoglycan-binding domain-containing protein [Pontibacter ruber]